MFDPGPEDMWAFLATKEFAGRVTARPRPGCDFRHVDAPLGEHPAGAVRQQAWQILGERRRKTDFEERLGCLGNPNVEGFTFHSRVLTGGNGREAEGSRSRA